MKHLFLIIRHFFPHSKWKIIETVEVMPPDFYNNKDSLPIRRDWVLQDQFGNIKVVKSN